MDFMPPRDPAQRAAMQREMAAHMQAHMALYGRLAPAPIESGWCERCMRLTTRMVPVARRSDDGTIRFVVGSACMECRTVSASADADVIG